MTDKILGLEVHPHLVGGITESIDKNGNKRIISSAIVKPHLNVDVPPLYMTNKEEIIDKIENKMFSLGFSSSKIIGLDELDNTIYKEGDINLIYNNVKCGEIKGLYYPYNTVVYHPKNKWKFDCLQFSFYMEHGIIPNSNHNIPRILNIPRSSGIIQKGILKEEEGIIIKDNEDIYIVVNFSIKDTEETQRELCNYTKKVPFQDILILNDDIREINITLPQIKENLQTEDIYEIGVKKHYSDKYIEWKNKTFMPLINNITNIKINVN